MRLAMILAAGLALATTSAAQKAPGTTLLSATNDAGTAPTPGQGTLTPANVVTTSVSGGTTTLTLAIDGEDSWDALNDPSNTVLTVALGAGASMTGIGWDVNLSTVGGSWLSEARFYFDGSDQDLTGLFLTPGVADALPGVGTYSSGGVLDLTDNGIADIPILADGILYIQLNESFDDVADAIDATWTDPSTLTIVYEGGGGAVPTVGEWGLIVLGVALLGGVVVMTLRRRATLRTPALAVD